MDEKFRQTLISGWPAHLETGLAGAILDAGEILYCSDGQKIYRFGDEQKYIYGVAQGVVRGL